MIGFFPSQNLPDLLLNQVPLLDADGMHVAIFTLHHLCLRANLSPSRCPVSTDRFSAATQQR